MAREGSGSSYDTQGHYYRGGLHAGRRGWSEGGVPFILGKNHCGLFVDSWWLAGMSRSGWWRRGAEPVQAWPGVLGVEGELEGR